MKYRSLTEEIKLLELGLPPKEDDGFIGGNLDPKEASLILIPVPWEATVSFGEGTSKAPDNIRLASHQLDVENYHYIKPYKAGISMLEVDKHILKLSNKTRKKALKVMEAIECGESCKKDLKYVNEVSKAINSHVYEAVLKRIKKDKFVAVVGGDHSCPLGLIKALDDTQKESFGILHVDAHHDLREAYEGFTYSHASIFYNVLNECKNVSKLIQIGIRDYSKEESQRMINLGDKGDCLYDTAMQAQIATGKSLEEVFTPYIEQLPKNVYISIDIDGLEPLNCPNTGTPVPGGFSFEQAAYLFSRLAETNKEIIGFDLVEVAPGDDDWDGNVGARMLFHMCGAFAKSQKMNVGNKIKFNK
mgnify:CR=1 FL=1